MVINLPKMKTHKKAGATLALKNLVGVSSERNWLPHYTLGSPSSGGDQFPEATVKRLSEGWAVRRFQSVTDRHPWMAPAFRGVKRLATPFWGHTQKVVRSGNWHGNDTCWRMVHDLNRAVLYGDGHEFPTSRRRR